MPITKPMLAAAVENVHKLPFPLIVTPKLDGIRCVVLDECAMSRTLKPIPNPHVRRLIEEHAMTGMDGEIMSGDTFQSTTSAVMRQHGEPKFIYWVFDWVNGGMDEPYEDRLSQLQLYFDKLTHREPLPPLRIVPYHRVNNPDELLAFEKQMLSAGFEGVCMRTPESPYKSGRSTLKQAWLLKLKRFVDSEAVVLALEEQLMNLNVAKKNALGRTERSSAKANKVGKDTLGKFLVRDVHSSVEFAIGTGDGLTEAMRDEIWLHRDEYVGRILKYRYQPVGVKVAPRLPIFIGWRSEEDL